MNFKNEKGITLIVLTIMIIVIIILSSIVVIEGSGLLSIKKVNEMYSDIGIINTEISNYYLRVGEIPVIEKYCDKSNMIHVFGDEKYLNPNDGNNYYVIDLSKLDNLTLNYGKDYKKWLNEKDKLSYDELREKYIDIYLINDVTLQVYYLKGTSSKGEQYYTKLDN